MTNPIEEMKKKTGEKAAEYVKDGMTIGLGSGTTVYWTIKKIGEMVNEGMNVKGIPSSRKTERLAKEFGVPLTDFSEVKRLDIAIDGADEVDPDFHLTKGGGGSLFREKVVDAAADKLIIVVDQSKMASTLGAFALPVEVVPFGWEVTADKVAQLGGVPERRIRDGEVFITDNGNYVLDCKFGSITDPQKLHDDLKRLLGVVETGLFIGMTDIVIIGESDGVKVLEKK